MKYGQKNPVSPDRKWHQTNHNKTGTSQVGAISKAQITSKGGPFGDKNKFKKKSHSAEKNRKGDPLHSFVATVL